MSDATVPPKSDSPLQFIEPHEMHFVAHVPSDGRFIPRITFHDGKSFVLYIPQPDGKLMVARPIDMVNGHYIAAEPANPEDVRDPFWEVVIRHFTFPSMSDFTISLHSDLVNALASLHRYFVLLRYAAETDDQAMPPLVTSELEYAFGNHRAFYDLLNGVLNLFRSEPQFSKTTLPATYRRTSQRTDDELASKFGMLDSFVEFVRSRESRFFLMRSIRDGIFHHGWSPVDIVFTFEDGFGIRAESELAVKLDELNLWNESSVRPNRIAALLPLLAFITADIWTGLSECASRMAEIDSCPTSLIGDLHVYHRSPLTQHLRRLTEYQERQWISPSEVLPKRRVQPAAN